MRLRQAGTVITVTGNEKLREWKVEYFVRFGEKVGNTAQARAKWGINDQKTFKNNVRRVKGRGRSLLEEDKEQNFAAIRGIRRSYYCGEANSLPGRPTGHRLSARLRDGVSTDLGAFRRGES